MGKGSRRRPAAVPQDEVDANWERTFGENPWVAERGELRQTALDGALERIEKEGTCPTD